MTPAKSERALSVQLLFLLDRNPFFYREERLSFRELHENYYYNIKFISETI